MGRLSDLIICLRELTEEDAVEKEEGDTRECAHSASSTAIERGKTEGFAFAHLAQSHLSGSAIVCALVQCEQH